MNDDVELSNLDEPLYNIGAVARMTDIAETTLRAWERRYSFPNSARTDGGHRLYSQREVSRLQWVKVQVDEGMQISQAIKALNHLEESGKAPELSILVASDTPEAFAKVNQHLLKALINHDIELADRTIAEALTIYSLEHLILNVFSPLMREIGSAWEDGKIDVATEHVATNFLRQYLLQWMRIAPPPYRVKSVVLACAPTELHEGSLLMLGVLLRRLRWPVIYLGQSIALHDFRTFVKQIEPSAIVFVAMTEESAETLSDWPRWLPEVYETKRPMVCFGGRIFTIEPDYTERVAGMFLGETLEDGLATLSKLLNELHPFVR